MSAALALKDALKRLHFLLPDRERDVLGIDLETTGTHPDQDELLEVGLARLSTNGRVTVHEGVYCPAKEPSQEILDLTGLTREELAAGRLWDAREAAVYVAGFAGCDFLGYNARRFDLPFFKKQCEKVGVAFDYSGARFVDPLVLWQVLEKRDLSAFVQRFAGRPHEGAHRAVADVAGTVEGLCKFLEVFQRAPRTVQGIHDLCFPRDASWADGEGKLAWIAGKLCVNFGKKYAGTPLSLMTSGKAREYLEWMLRAEFPADTKQLIGDFLHGGKLPLEPGATPAPAPDETPF